MPEINNTILSNNGASKDITDLFTLLQNPNNKKIGVDRIYQIEACLSGKIQLLGFISNLLNCDTPPNVPAYVDPNKYREKLIRNIKINLKWLDMFNIDLIPDLPPLNLLPESTPLFLDGATLIWPVFESIFRENSNNLKFCSNDGLKNFIIEPYTVNSTLIYDKILRDSNNGISMNYNCRLENDTSKTYIIRIHSNNNQYTNDASYINSLEYDEYLPVIHYYGKINFFYNFINMNGFNFNLSPNKYKYQYSYTIIDHYEKISSNLLDAKSNSQKLEFLINLIKLLELLYSNNKLLTGSSYLGFKQNMPILLVDPQIPDVYITIPKIKTPNLIISINTDVITWLRDLIIRFDLKAVINTTGSNIGTRIYDIPAPLRFDKPTFDICDLHMSFKLDTVAGTQLNYTRIRKILEWIRDKKNLLENP